MTSTSSMSTAITEKEMAILVLSFTSKDAVIKTEI